MNYKLEKEAAIKATGSSRITETGAYVGKFTRAEAIESQYGTKGIEFSFVDENDNTADFLTLYTVKSNGEKISFGYNQVMALMTCLKVKEIEKSFGMVSKYDFKSNQVKQQRAEIYPALMNKDIGLLLQAEEYQSNDGSAKTRMVIAGFFEAATGLMAKEILENITVPELMEKFASKMPAVKKMKGGTSSSSSPSSPLSGSSSIDDDDIPF